MEESSASAGRQRNHASQIITEGHVWTAVWYLAWPTAINTIIQSAYGLVNVWFVGHLPDATQALAAVGIGTQVLFLQFGMVVALSAGASALVARFLGAQEYEDADKVAGQTWMLSVITGLASSLPIIVFASPLASLIGAKDAALPLAANYTILIAWFSVPMFLIVNITATLRAAGDVRGPLVVNTAVLAINAVLDWFLILGNGPFPQMGVHGAAWATSISRIIGLVFSYGLLRRSVLRGSVGHLGLDWDWCKRILNIGWPAALQNLLWSTGSAAYRGVLGVLPAAQVNPAQAALTVALQIESLAFMPGIAYSMAATPLVGQNLGAGKPDRAAHTAWIATGQAVVIMTLVALVFLFAPGFLARSFTKDAAVIALIVSYLRINAISEPLLAVNMVLRGALQGAGDTRMPMFLTIATLWLIRMPLAWLLVVPAGYGATGAWIAMSVTTGISGLLMMWWFRRGNWRTIEV